MIHLRIFLTLSLALLGLGSSAWLPGSLHAAVASPPPDAPTAAGWHAIQTQVAKLTASDGAQGDWLGYSVSVSSDTAVVGARHAGVGGNFDQGAAYVFYRDQGGPDAWGQVAKLTASDGAAWDHFGGSVSVSGDTALVGAAGSGDEGAAYVFSRDQGGPDAWGQVAKLTASDGAGGDAFGTSVSVSGDTAVVGAQWAGVGDHPYQGAAYAFRRSLGGPDAWGQAAKLTAADGAAGDQFGASVSVSGATIAAGAVGADIGANPNQGAAYIFYAAQGGPDAWDQVARLSPSDGAMEMLFGSSVSVSGSTAVVGAPFADAGGNYDQGAAYVFDRDLGGADAWGQAAKLIAADGAASDYFGSAVSVSGDIAVAGAPYAAVGSEQDQGAAYVYYRDLGGPDAWGQAAELTAADGDADDYFGWAVSVDAGTLVAGAGGADIGGNPYQGAAYVYYQAPPTMHVASVSLTKAGTGPWTLTGKGKIHDGSHSDLPGVLVQAQWLLPNGSKVYRSFTTGAQGGYQFNWNAQGSGQFRFCIVGLVKASYTYVKADNHVQPPCRLISTP